MEWKIDPPKSLTEVAVQRIREAIIDGRLILGEKLSEQKLADLLVISRSPVRDALAILQSEGLVHVIPKRGSFVFLPQLNEVIDLCECRGIMESAAIKLGMIKNQIRLIQDLKNHIEKMQCAGRNGDALGYAREDAAFHKTIILSSSNRNLEIAYQRIIGPVLALRNHLFIAMNEVFNHSMYQHIEILQACETGDQEHAIDVLVKHIDQLPLVFDKARQSEVKGLKSGLRLALP